MKKIKDIQAVYKKEIDNYALQVKKLSGQILSLSLIRLLIFLVSGLGIYFLWSSTAIVVGIIASFVLSFIFLVKKHTELKEKRSKIKILIDINTQEIIALGGDFSHFKNGKVYKDPTHDFAEDIDLFGERSFFQFLNRTGLVHGEKELAKMLKSNHINNITDKQNVVKDLSKRLKFRQNFTAECMMLDNQKELYNTLIQLIEHKSFVPKFLKYVSLIFSLLSIAVIFLYAFGVIGEMQLLFWIFIGLGGTGFFIKKVNSLSVLTAKGQDMFKQYQKLILALENEKFEAKVLKEKQSKILLEPQKASLALKQFSKHIDNLEQRQNMIMGFVLNALFLWDIQQSLKIENWLEEHRQHLKNWFETIAYFDAQNSLANMTYNQASYTFPEINQNKKDIISCQKGAHPLIDKDKVVTNDFLINNEDFLIITGANMAGKSTFLRTVSLMIVMANTGLPVCASYCKYKPVKLITSMRTSDSLSDEASYFYSELSRLKTIVEHLQNDCYFIVLDEILKGTNSHDKAKGSQQFIEKLVKTKSSGIIATHDLSLCKLAKQLPEVHNYYFDAQIIDGELYFDYTFKKGICENMNASFLLKKMGIV